jgi:branched-chain amino acid transport system ATP-binding protein
MAPLIDIKGLVKDFGGLRAIDHLDFSLERGEVGAIIGPNGAGKTTFFNMVSGFLKPSSGQVIFKGEDITGFPPHAIAKRGIIRTFQLSHIFPDLDVFENVILSAQSKRIACLGIWFEKEKKRESERRSLESLRTVALADFSKSLAGSLSHGYHKPLEMAMALAFEAELLLLDEPASGLSTEEAKRMILLLQNISRTGISMIIVEHNMEVVFSLAQKILVLQFGKKIAEGIPEDIRKNEKVVKAYLGED